MPASILHTPPWPWAHLDRQDSSPWCSQKSEKEKRTSNFTQRESTVFPTLVFALRKPQLRGVQPNTEVSGGAFEDPDHSPRCLSLRRSAAAHRHPDNLLDPSRVRREVSSRLWLQAQPVAAGSLGRRLPLAFPSSPPPGRAPSCPLSPSPSSAGSSPGLRDTKEWAAGRARQGGRGKPGDSRNPPPGAGGGVAPVTWLPQRVPRRCTGVAREKGNPGDVPSP